MLKKIRYILVIGFLIVSTSSFADLDYSTMLKKGNITIEHRNPEKFEIENKLNIFMDLCDKLIREKFNNSEQVYIYLNQNYIESDTRYYALSYGKHPLFAFEKSSPENNKTGFKIIIKDGDFDIKKILQLVNAAFININIIKENQTKLVVSVRYYGNNGIDTVTSIPFTQVYKYLNTNDSTINKILSEKCYRKLKKSEDFDGTDYYYLNNQFQFYKVGDKDEKVFLKTDNVFEIVGSHKKASFIFINDSSFYFISQHAENTLGPYIINVAPGRLPIEEYYSEWNPLEKHYLFIPRYGGKSKVLFLPGKNLVISNYDSLENDIINKIISKPEQEIIPKKTNKSTLFVYIIAILNLIIILALIIKIKK